MNPNRRAVKVVDEDGAPVPEAFVAVEASAQPFPEIALVTDQTGNVHLPLPDGYCRLGATKDDRSGSVEIHAGESEPGDEIVIHLSPGKG